MNEKKTINILIAEDSKFNQMIIERIMHDLEYNYILVENGQLAVDQSMNKAFHMILMDVEMPVLDGILATITIRENAENPNHSTPIIGFTNHINPIKQKEFLAAGMNEVINKPFNKEGIREICEKYENSVSQNTKNMLKNIVSSDSKEIQYNLSYLKEFTFGDDKFFTEMLTYFVNNTPTVASRIQIALKQSNWEELRLLAHKYSSEIAFVGVSSITENLNKLEQYHFKTIDQNELAILVNNIVMECMLVADKITKDYNL